MIIPLLCGIFLAQAGSLDAVAPAYPAQAFQGGTVVAEMVVSGGRVTHVRILSGDEPFVQPTLDALRQWRIPKDRGDGVALAIVNFRGPNLHAVGSRVQSLNVRHESESLPVPKAVVEPNYPPNSMGEGGVVLQCKVSDSGRISEMKVIRGQSGLTDSCSDAVRQWKLEPARDGAGKPATAEIYGVCVFRQPVLSVPK